MVTRNNATQENCYVLGDQDSISGKESNHSLLCHHQNGSGTLKASYPIEVTETGV
jgi:hypothetical protein